jgi:diguanylate cyclase (GGDEF)-like protein/PAS domain S-box-containing protein
MHFVGMLAFQGPSRTISYDIPLTLLSLLIAIVFTGLGLGLVFSRAGHFKPLIFSGVAMGLGIALMHYTGMAAMKMEASTSYDPALVAASVAIGIIASTAALWLAFNTRIFAARMAAAAVMAIAVSAMHYTAMAAARFTMPESLSGHLAAMPPAELASQTSLTIGAVVVTCIILFIGIVASYVDQRLAERERGVATALATTNEDLAREIEARRSVQTDLDAAQKALSDQRFDRLADSMSTALLCADHRGRITSWNRAAEVIFGYPQVEAVGQSVEIIIPERLRAAHSAGLARMASTGQSKLAGKTVELQAARQNGEEFPAELSLSTWMENGQIAFGAIIRDISDRLETQERLRLLAYRDQLTGLPNRQAFGDALRSATGSQTGKGIALLLLDLDGFKEVNDSRGHSAGDIVLIASADRLRDNVPKGAEVSRLGGDEFAILLPIGTDIVVVAEQVIAAFDAPIHAGGRPFQVGTSIGIAIFPDDASDADEWLVNADLALYRAKSDSRGRYEFFTPALAEALQLKQTMEMELLRAYTRNEFELYYQPLVRLADGALMGAEALLRWNHPHQGMLLPAAFLPTLETTSLAEAVGTWVLQTACAQGVQWQREAQPLRMSVNLFAAQFQSGNLKSKVAHALATSGLAAAHLELEITENIALAQDETMMAALNEIHGLGVDIAFDDFGTGFGSMSMLKRFPVTRLKIDRSFVQDLVENNDDICIVRAIIGLGSSLGLEVIAEGIETEDQRTQLLALGCSEGQGYYYGRPMSAWDFQALLLSVSPDKAIQLATAH